MVKIELTCRNVHINEKRYKQRLRTALVPSEQHSAVNAVMMKGVTLDCLPSQVLDDDVATRPHPLHKQN